jgi:hypothetical protein
MQRVMYIGLFCLVVRAASAEPFVLSGKGEMQATNDTLWRPTAVVSYGGRAYVGMLECIPDGNQYDVRLGIWGIDRANDSLKQLASFPDVLHVKYPRPEMLAHVTVLGNGEFAAALDRDGVQSVVRVGKGAPKTFSLEKVAKAVESPLINRILADRAGGLALIGKIGSAASLVRVDNQGNVVSRSGFTFDAFNVAFDAIDEGQHSQYVLAGYSYNKTESGFWWVARVTADGAVLKQDMFAAPVRPLTLCKLMRVGQRLAMVYSDYYSGMRCRLYSAELAKLSDNVVLPEHNPVSQFQVDSIGSKLLICADDREWRPVLIIMAADGKVLSKQALPSNGRWSGPPLVGIDDGKLVKISVDKVPPKRSAGASVSWKEYSVPVSTEAAAAASGPSE